ncbi:MAG: hypothetical protein AAFQ41_03150 [Cyanobacteria bacterium J06623_7]
MSEPDDKNSDRPDDNPNYSEPDYSAVDAGFCPHCYSELDFCLAGEPGYEYCVMCGMDI